MRRAGLVLAAALAVGLAVPASAGTPRFLGVTAYDSYYHLSKLTIRHGKIDFSLDNHHGADPHNVVIARHKDHSGEVATLDTADPGNVTEKTVKLAPGTYYLYCSLASHEAQGMHVHLTVK